MNKLTGVLERARSGDVAAYNEAFKLLYRDLRRLARARLSKGGRSLVLDTSALINETYIRLAPVSGLRVESGLAAIRVTRAVATGISVALTLSRDR